MKIYTGTSWSKPIQDYCASHNIGMMSSPFDPVHPDKIIPEINVALDNGAFRNFRDKTRFCNKKFYTWLNSIKRRIDFVPLPDIVCGSMGSYNFSKEHINNISLKKYLVVQDGMTFDLVYPLLSLSVMVVLSEDLLLLGRQTDGNGKPLLIGSSIATKSIYQFIWEDAQGT